MLVTNIYNIVDTAFVGTLGTSQSGATGGWKHNVRKSLQEEYTGGTATVACVDIFCMYLYVQTVFEKSLVMNYFGPHLYILNNIYINAKCI